MYFKLVKVFFKQNFSLERFLGSSMKGSKTKSILLGVVIVFGLSSLLFSFGYLFFELGKLFKALNALDALLTYIFMYATFMSAFFIILRASGYLFHYKDYDFLSSLPIKNEVVLAAKITVMMLMVYLSTYILTAPMVFSYLYHGGFSLYQLLAILILILFIPILPLVIFSFLALLIDTIITKFRLGKIIGAVLTFGLLLGYMYFVFSFNAETENPFVSQRGFLESVSQYIPTATLFQNAVSDQNILQFLLFIVINALLLVAYIYLTKDLINHTNQKKVKVFRRKNKQYKYKQNSLIEALVKKEFKKFFSVNIYLMNTGFGPVLMFVGGILALFYSSQIQDFAAQMIGASLDFELTLLILVGFFITTVYTTAISLSLEGKNFWLIRSLPIPARTVMMGKIIFNVLLGLPFAIFLIGAVGFSLSIDFIIILLMMVFIASFSFATSILGSIVNLYFPKFEFKNETEVVKQSAGALLGMFSGWILLIVFALLKAFVFEAMALEWVLLIFTAINILCFVICYLHIDKKAESLFIQYS
jgi:ABC-2 type transport system permease protein